MEREQIIKALECCTSGRPCRGCDFKDKSKDTFGCRKQLLIDALSLIKELTEEVDSLEAQKEHLDLLVDGKLKRISALEKNVLSLTEENERLRAENARYEAENHEKFDKWMKLEEATKRHHAELFQEAKIAVKEETVRKMSERFIAEIEQTPNANEHFIKAWKSKIDQIAKEMIGEENEQR